MAVSPSEALAQRRATYQDVLAAPAHQVAEIIKRHPAHAPTTGAGAWRGEFQPRVSNSDPRSVAGVEARAGGGSTSSRSYTSATPILVPDLAGWRRERMPELPDTAYFHARSGLGRARCCRRRRAGSTCRKSDRLYALYAREGVAYLWLIDPTDRTLEAFELRDGEWVLIACAKDDEPVSVRPVRRDHVQLGGSLAVVEAFAVALSGEPKGWLVEAASADEAIDIVHGTVPRAREAGRERAARMDRALLPRPVPPRCRDAGELDATVTPRKCYGCAGTGRCGVCE